MEAQPVRWSELKQKDLERKLEGYWLEDNWQIGNCPLQDGCKDYSANKTIYFSCKSLYINAEIKYVCWQKLEQGEWKTKTLWALSYKIRDLCNWLNTRPFNISSLLERDLQSLQIAFRSYLYEHELFREYKQTKLSADQTYREYSQGSPHLNLLSRIYKKLEELYDYRDEYEKQVWDVRKLGYSGNQCKSTYTLNFSGITQSWLLKAAKAFIKYSLTIFSLGECQARVAVIRQFSCFLRELHPNLRSLEINRPIIVEYLSLLPQTGIRESAQLNHLIRLRNFLEICARESWAEVPDKQLIYREDMPRLPKLQPRYIPDNVLIQLNENLDGLPEQIKRMVLVIQEVGMRISELCKLSFDCLLQDAQGDFFLRYYQYKMKKEHSVPISKEVVAVIQEQKQFVKETYGQQSYLFPSPQKWHKGEPTKHQNFSRAINRLASEREICDQSGKIWRFQAHQFRHTVGTRMINSGVPQHIIQRYLGHQSPEMTNVYAHIHDKTLKEEFIKFKDKIVDVTGKTIIPKNIPEENSESQWLKKKILAQALPNGSCALPIVAGECPHANACLSCTHFRTDIRFLDEHKKQLEQTERIIETAQANGWVRQSEMNYKVKTNLESIIAALEDSDETSA